MNLDRYPGAKSGSGIIQWLINHIPLHERYFELFAGSAQLYRAKRPAKGNYLCDINEGVIQALAAENIHRPTGWLIGPALWVLKQSATGGPKDRNDFVYLDPPYPKAARRSGKAYYKFEMLEDDDHVQLLSAILESPANVMISTRQNELYDSMLKHWRKDTFQTADRAGVAEEVIYMNYQAPATLHQYDYVGDGFADRQRIKRKVDRFASKIAMLPAYERHMFIQQLIRHDAPAVQLFLSMLSGNNTP